MSLAKLWKKFRFLKKISKELLNIFNFDRAFWRFVMVPQDMRDHFEFMDPNHDGLVSLTEYVMLHKVFFYLQ